MVQASGVAGIFWKEGAFGGGGGCEFVLIRNDVHTFFDRNRYDMSISTDFVIFMHLRAELNTIAPASPRSLLLWFKLL